MIKVSWGQLNDKTVFSALQRLYGTPNLDGGTAYKISRIWEAGAKEMEKMRAEEIKLRNVHCVATSPDGTVSANADGEYEFKSEEARQEMVKAMEAIMESNFLELKVSKISFPTIVNVGLAPLHFTAIGFMLDNLPDLEAEPQKPSGLVLPQGLVGIPAGLRG